MSDNNKFPKYRQNFLYNPPKIVPTNLNVRSQTQSWFNLFMNHKPNPKHTELPKNQSMVSSQFLEFKKQLLFPWLMNLKYDEINKTPFGIQEKQYEANSPTEDRLVVKELDHKEGYLLGVFDGHGGGHLAQQASKRIHSLFQKNYEQLKKDIKNKKQAMEKALIEAFNTLEQGFLEKASQQIKEKKKYKKIGSCALCCVLTKEFIIVANAGDSKAILVNQQSGQTTELNQMFNTHNQKQLERLMQQHSDEDILVTNSKNGAKYLKGCLIPTRCFGDFHLKHQQFAEGVIKFNKSYITHKPDIRSFELNNNMKYYLVTGSDGLWDQLNDEEISRTILKTEDLNKADALVDAALDRIAEKNGTDHIKIRELSPKKRRDYHDDISIIVANLEQLY